MQTFLSVTDFRHAFSPPLARDLTYKLLKEKRIKSMRLGNKFYIPQEAVELFINTEMANPASADTALLG